MCVCDRQRDRVSVKCGDVGNLQNVLVCYVLVCFGGGDLECGFIYIYEALYQIWVSASTPGVVGVGC